MSSYFSFFYFQFSIFKMKIECLFIKLAFFSISKYIGRMPHNAVVIFLLRQTNKNARIWQEHLFWACSLTGVPNIISRQWRYLEYLWVELREEAWEGISTIIHLSQPYLWIWNILNLQTQLHPAFSSAWCTEWEWVSVLVLHSRSFNISGTKILSNKKFRLRVRNRNIYWKEKGKGK